LFLFLYNKTQKNKLFFFHLLRSPANDLGSMKEDTISFMVNQLKTILLMGILSVILIAIGGAIGGSTGVMICLIFSLGMNLFQYFYSDSIVIRSCGAYPLSANEYPELHRMVQQLTTQAGIPMPALYIMPTPQPNAFATGRNPEHAAVVVTQGILQTLSGSELEGVLAHELSHIKNRDILISTIAAAFASAISGIASIVRWGAIFGGFSRDDEDGSAAAGLLMAIVAPIAATIVQLAVSRSREYLADESAARLTRNPRALANALLRLENGVKHIPMQQATPSMAHMYIVQPFVGQGLLNLFSTHPSTQDRVDRLYKMVV